MPKEFLHVLPVEAVVSLLLSASPLDRETVSLDALFLERVLAETLWSGEDVPAANRSGMDGYAVCAADLFGVSENNPGWLDCIGDIAIDAPPAFSLQPGQCASIVTGGYLPEGADAVVMVEHTHPLGAGVIAFRRAAAPGQYVMRKGEDAEKGGLLLPRGTVLRAQEAGLLAALGVTEIPVVRRPNVAILSTGDELVAPEETPRPGQIRDVNTTVLATMTAKMAHVEVLGIVPDTLASLENALRRALSGRNGVPPDVLFLSGGSSVGVRDLTLEALHALGDAEILCHGVALSPGKPLILARCGKTFVWGLPGQIASAQVVMHVLGIPFLRHLAGYSISALAEEGAHGHAFQQQFWPVRQAVLARNVASRQGREEYVRVRLEYEGDRVRAVPVLGLSGLMRTVLKADGLVRIPARLEGLEAGTPVDVLLF